MSQRAPSGPARIRYIQDDYGAEMYRRFRAVKGLIRETVADNDAFALTSDAPGVQEDTAPTRRYAYPTSREKIDAFLEDLRRWEDIEILDVTPDVPGSRDEWQNTYVTKSYQKGVAYADARLREAGVELPAGATVGDVFNAPVHAEALGVLYTRNFQELKGITSSMDQEISRVLTQGFAEGWNPRKMATELNRRVDVGLTRARTLARTETMRAHSEATLNRYRQTLGQDARVEGRAELRTAGDARVCELCLGIEGMVVPISEARGILPVHPNCRCVWLPVVQDARNTTGGVPA